VSIRGSMNGLEFKRAAKLDFPKEDLQNPEIERMWASKRIDGILKDADRAGTRTPQVIDDVVRLGEGYSIVTEYTSFLVLENDAEFQRWKIARNNVLRNDRDRRVQQMARTEFDSMRRKAMADLGPQSERSEMAMARPIPQPPGLSSPPQPQGQPSPKAQPPQQSSGKGFNFSPGSGPVGPITVLLLAAASRLKRRRTQG